MNRIDMQRRHWPLRAGFPAALLYLLAAASLTLMSLAYEPRLLPPLIAFAAMVALTRQLGRRLYGDFARASDHRK